MKRLDGNITAELQTKIDGGLNDIGEQVTQWQTIATPTGFLDMTGQSTKYTDFAAKVADSTHVFLFDYQGDIPAENLRMIIKGQIYDVLFVDCPMELKYHYELYLKYRGRQ